MIKPLIALILMLFVFDSSFAEGTVLNAAKFPEIIKMNKVLQDPVLSIKGAIEKPESYILKLEAKSPQGSQNLTAYLDKSTLELYIGSAYDKNGKIIIFPKDSKIVNNGVAFTYGNGSKEIYLVTDPECPYCGRFARASNNKLGDYTVHVILLPLSFHKKSPAMIEWIMRGKDDAQRKERYDALMLEGSTKYKSVIKDEKKPFMYSSEVQKQMQKSNDTTRELDVRGTPALYDTHFNPISQGEVLKQTGKVK